MQAGKLRYPVTIERPVRTRTPDLEFVTTWELVGREWADIESISGSDFVHPRPSRRPCSVFASGTAKTWYRAGAYVKGRGCTKSLPCCQTLAAGGSS